MAEKKKGCYIAAIGCGAVLIIGGIIAAAVGIWSVKTAGKIKADLKDPLARTKEILNVETLPENYHPQMAMSIPFIMDWVIISNREREEVSDTDEIPEPDFGSEGLMYFNFILGGRNPQGLHDFFEGKSDDADVLRENNIQIDTDEIINRGTLDLEGQKLLYLTQRGGVKLKEGSTRGLSTLFLVLCPNDKRMRFGIWFGEDPMPEVAAEALALEGSVGDLERLTSFLGHFHFCPNP